MNDSSPPNTILSYFVPVVLHAQACKILTNAVLPAFVRPARTTIIRAAQIAKMQRRMQLHIHDVAAFLEQDLCIKLAISRCTFSASVVHQNMHRQACWLLTLCTVSRACALHLVLSELDQMAQILELSYGTNAR